MTASLRQMALVWMTVLLTCVGTAAMLIGYRVTLNEAAEFLDGQLRQVALNAGVGLPDANAPPATDPDPEDQIAVTIWRMGTIVHDDLPNIEISLPRQRGYADVTLAGERWRTYAFGDGIWSVQAAQRDAVRQEYARNAAVGVAAPILIVIPLSWIVVGWVMTRMLRRLDVLAQELARRSAAAADPLPLAGIPAEVVPLIESMNGLIVRLGAAVDAQRRFLADAAHELRTPLAAVQIQADNLASAAPEEVEVRRRAIASGVRRAGDLVQELLRLARLDQPTAPPSDTIDLGPLLLDCVSIHVVLAEHKGVDLGVSIEQPTTLRGSRDELRVLFVNLIDNAVRYTPRGGQVDVRLYGVAEHILVDVLDTGRGLPPGSESRIFNRFYRAAPSDVDGAGLGLPIARRVAERNGLGLTVTNRADGRTGVLARVTLS